MKLWTEDRPEQLVRYEKSFYGTEVKGRLHMLDPEVQVKVQAEPKINSRLRCYSLKTS